MSRLITETKECFECSAVIEKSERRCPVCFDIRINAEQAAAIMQVSAQARDFTYSYLIGASLFAIIIYMIWTH